MTNAEKFKEIFGLYATELWSKSEKNFLNWLNAEVLEQEPCSDAISRQAAMDAIGFPSLNVLLADLPSVSDHAEQRTGHWIKAQQRGITIYSDAYAECDCCHDEQGYEPTYMGWGMKYCPNCGAKMEADHA